MNHSFPVLFYNVFLGIPKFIRTQKNIIKSYWKAVIPQLLSAKFVRLTIDENFRQTKKQFLTTPLRFDDVNVIRRWLWEHFDGFNDRKFDCSGYESWRLSLSCSIRPPQFSNFSYRAHKTFWQCFKTPTVPLKLSTMHRTLKHDIFFTRLLSSTTGNVSTSYRTTCVDVRRRRRLAARTVDDVKRRAGRRHVSLRKCPYTS